MDPSVVGGVSTSATDMAEDAQGKKTEGKAALQAKAMQLDDHLEDALPPSLRTAKKIAQKLGANKAAREFSTCLYCRYWAEI
jgi:hypothetical protein